MSGFSLVKWGDGLSVTDEGEGVIRVDGAGGVGPEGPPGPEGPVGPAGPPGPGGADANFVHTQIAGSTSWVVTHGLGKYPAVSVTDSGGSFLIPDVHYDDLNTATLGFSLPTTGKAVFN